MDIKVFPTRYVLTMLGFFGMFNMFAMRVNLSVAIVAMVKEPHVANEPGMERGEACEELLDEFRNHSTSVQNTSHSLKGEFDWDSNTQGLVLGSYFYGSFITQIPGGILAEKYGAKWFFGIGILVNSIFTILTPIAARWSVGAIFFARFMEGLAQGVTLPAINSLIARWAPKMERSRMSTLIFTGCQIGTVLSLSISGILSDSSFLGGWPATFYLFGTLGCIWFIFWAFLVYESPETHPRISKEELVYIHQHQDGRLSSKPSFPWKSILTSVPLWALVITHVGLAWVYLTLIIELPTYFSKILHFGLKKSGILSSLPNLLFPFTAICASIVVDKLRKNGRLKISTIRKIFNSIAFFGSAICLLIASFLGCRSVAIVAVIAIGMGSLGCIHSGFEVTHVDMSPEFAGILYGITNFFASTCGFLVPAFVGWIIQDGETVQSWRIIFITASFILIITGLTYNIFGSAELQTWNGEAQSLESTKAPRTFKMNETTFLVLKDCHSTKQ